MSIVIYPFDRPMAEIDAGRHSSRAGAVAGATRFNVKQAVSGGLNA